MGQRQYMDISEMSELESLEHVLGSDLSNKAKTIRKNYAENGMKIGVVIGASVGATLGYLNSDPEYRGFATSLGAFVGVTLGMPLGYLAGRFLSKYSIINLSDTTNLPRRELLKKYTKLLI